MFSSNIFGPRPLFGVLTSKKRIRQIYIPISEQKGDFQGATAIHTYMPLNKCEIKAAVEKYSSHRSVEVIYPCYASRS